MSATLARNHFSIEQEHRIAADPAVVFSILMTRPDEWWGNAHRSSTRANAEIQLDSKPLG